MGGWKFYFPLFTHLNINSPKRNFSMTESVCLPCCALCPDLVIMAALAAMYLESALSPCHHPSPIWHHQCSADSGHWTSAPSPGCPCPVPIFIPHFTSSDFTMHKQSKFRERSLVRSCTASASDPAGHTCAVLLHSCEHLTFGYFPMSHFLTIYHQWLTQKSPVRVSGHDFNL